MTIRPIKTEADYEMALSRISALFESKPNTNEGDELDVLSTLVEAYEAKHFPIESPDPVSAIKFRMNQQGLKSKDLIPFIGSKSKVSEILSGKRRLSLAMIRNLSIGLNIPAEILIQNQCAELPDEEIMKHGSNFPFTEMFSRGWFSGFFDGTLQSAKIYKKELLTKFIGSFSINDFSLCYNRKSKTESSKQTEETLLAWRIRVMNIAASNTGIPTWNSNVLSDDFFEELSALSCKENGPWLAKEMLNQKGIHFVVEKHLKSTHLDGSSMLMPDKSPLVALTLRYDRLDSFWFTLFHELAHVKLHLTDTNMAFFDDMTDEMKDSEGEADSFAKKMLIPDDVWNSSGLTVYSSSRDLCEFSHKHRINPAITAGRLRFENNNYKAFSSLIGNGKVRCLFQGA